MINVSDRFLDAVQTSHRVVVEADVLDRGEVVAENLSVAAGSITLDGGARIRGRFSATFAEPVKTEQAYRHGHRGIGFEVAIRRGVAFPDGTTELVPLGVFEVEDVALSRWHTVGVSGMDRSTLVADARFEADEPVAAGSPIESVASRFVAASVPWAPIQVAQSGAKTPASVFEMQADRMAAVTDLATAGGLAAFFDGEGTFRMASLSASDVPVWTVSDGPGGVLVDATVSARRRPSFNRVVAYSTSSTTGQVYSGVATDTDPTSPTYYYGRFGRKPRFFSSPLLSSNSQCVAAARSLLRRVRGIAVSLDLAMVPNPALEPGDTIRVSRNRLGVDEIHLIDSMTIDLGVGGMTVQSRAAQELVTE